MTITNQSKFLNYFTFTVALFAILTFSNPSLAQSRYAHFILDANTGKVLSAENADVLNHPASLTKMMTLYIVFEALRDGRLKWDQQIAMTKNGAATIPYKLGVPAGKTFTVREAAYGMVIRSANDAAEAMGDHLAGSEAKFGRMMTQKARQLGMNNTTFRNASGLPDKRQITTARDMAKLGFALMRDFPREYALFSERSFKFRGRSIRGHNNLMYRYEGMDGIKTGFINASGFNVVSAVNANGRRVIGVVLGGKTAKSRDDRMASLLDAAMLQASPKRGRHLVAQGSSSGAFEQPEKNLPMVANRQDPIANKIASADVDLAASVQGSLTVGSKSKRSEWEVQIAATNTKADALSLLSEAHGKIRDRFSEVAPHTEKVVSGSATLYRARLTGFDSRSSARSACKKLKMHAFSCMVLANES